MSSLPSVRAGIPEVWKQLNLQITKTNNIVLIPFKLYALLSLDELVFIRDQYFTATGLVPTCFKDAKDHRVYLLPATTQNLNHGANLPLPLPGYALPVVPHNPHPLFVQAIGEADAALNAINTVNVVNAVNAAVNAVNALSQGPAAGTADSGASGDFKIPRPPNAWILFRKYHHASVAAANPHLMNVQLSRVIGDMWQDADPLVRRAFKAKADEAKRIHQETYPGYSYKPRRSSEVKRRRGRAGVSNAATTSTSGPQASQGVANAGMNGGSGVSDPFATTSTSGVGPNPFVTACASGVSSYAPVMKGNSGGSGPASMHSPAGTSGFGGASGGFGGASGGFGGASGGLGGASGGLGGASGGFGGATGGYGTASGGYGTASGGYGTASGGYGTASGGYGTGSGYSTASGGYGTASGGYGTGSGYSTAGSGYGTASGGTESGSGFGTAGSGSGTTSGSGQGVAATAGRKAKTIDEWLGDALDIN